MTESELPNSELFKKIGMRENVIKKMIKNEAKSSLLRAVILESSFDLNSDINPRMGNVLINFGTHKKIGKVSPNHRKLISSLILEGNIEKNNQIDAAIHFFLELPEGGIFNVEDFHKACGVGVVVTEEDIIRNVESYLDDISNEEIMTTPSLGNFNRGLKDKFPEMNWADGRLVNKTVQSSCFERLGISDMKAFKSMQKKMAKENNLLLAIRFRARELDIAKNSPEILEEHNQITGGKVITRFPPEPNGYLHIGHAKSMLFNFGYAEQKGGECNLRFDDTNPEKESQAFLDGILEVIDWMGYKPARIVYSSDYFDQLYEFAVLLIRKGLAYMDFSKKSEIRMQRSSRTESPFRNKFSVEENIRIFEGMKYGKYDEGEVCYRLKIDAGSDNPNMRDFIGYRIKFLPHARTKNKWCIYPTYEFTHCLSDSIEHVTHSMCTLEFESKREPYYWLLHQLEMYKPFVWEFSRLSVTTSELSKRKINFMIAEGKVKGFDDPRLLTLYGLRRRGYSPEVIRRFCAELGASRTSDTYVDIQKLEQTCRIIMDRNCLRRFCVINPLRVVLTNMNDSSRTVKALNHPNNRGLGTRDMIITPVLFIERDDFRLVDDEEYFGLAPNKSVGLRYGPNIKCEEVIMSKENPNIVEELRCTVDFEKSVATRGHIHWVAEPEKGKEPCVVETRFYGYLLNIRNLEKGMNVMEHLTENSEVIKRNCYIEEGILDDLKKESEMFNCRFQFERVGFFVADPDTDLENRKIVFNQIVTLKESKQKKSLNKGKKKKKKKKGGKKK